jgi:membrane protease YdiL (CAAX protease family)
MDLRDKLNRMSNREIYLNLLLTQTLLFLLGVILYLIFLRGKLRLEQIFHFEQLGLALAAGFLFAVLVLLIDVVLMRILPPDYFDDGGINERLFRDTNVWQIAVIALGVALVEEWLFRAVLQNMLGWYWASLLFALLHFRYLHKWLYSLLIILISFGFGLLYHWTESFWSVFFAHFMIDFCMGLMIRYQWLPFQKTDKRNLAVEAEAGEEIHETKEDE